MAFQQNNQKYSKSFFHVKSLVLSFLLLVAFASFVSAAEDDDCYTCHSDPTLAREVNGKEVSVYVKPDILKGTVHEGNGCISCHPDADVEEFPHDAPLQKVDCSQCHDDVAIVYAHSLHGKALEKGDPDAPTCTDCHGKHVILSHKNSHSPTYVMNIPATCGKCHSENADVAQRHNISQKDIIKNYSMSIHGKGLFEGGLIVTAVCTSCHTAHDVLPPTDPKSTIARSNISATCMQCHANIEKVHQKVIRGELWEKSPNAIPVCVDCHSPHQIRRVFYAEQFTDDYCMSCHKNKSLVKTRSDGTIDSLYVNPADIQHSAHNQNISCVKCHVNVSQKKSPICKDSGPVDCSMCHAQESEDFYAGIHGQLLKKGDPNAPKCTDCHGKHDILPKTDLASPIFPRNIPTTCAQCHRQGEQAAIRYFGKETKIVSHYKMSIHGKGLLESGLMVSAVCSDCHTAHKELPASDPNSSVNPVNVAQTCATCHLGIYETFKNSSHSPTITKTDKKLPTCNDCHKAHEIERVDKDDFRNEILTQCGGCHEDVTKTYFETYHGKASKLGYAKAAKCYDCHGSHNILPPGNPASTLSPKHIVQTCKKCHPNSNRKFTGYLTHATHHNRNKYPYLFYSFWAMTFLLIGVFGFFGIHTLFWIPRSIRERMKLRKQLTEKPTRYMKRFDAFPRILHLLVIISFLSLAVTGMALKFSGYEWALVIMKALGGIQVARLIHRAAALVTFLYFGLHFVYIYQSAKKENKSFFKFMFGKNGMVPQKRDFIEFFQTIRWFFGRGPAPQYGRWTYWEKFDYLAVFWGVAIIGFSGLILWFPEFFTKFLPGVWINVATIIHSDEALLAAGFIFTIHFFNTHFRPQRFPMDKVIFTGKVPFDEWKHERPREYEQLKQQGTLEQHLDDNPPPRWLVISAKIFGFAALITGIILIVMIIWAMLFQYR